MKALALARVAAASGLLGAAGRASSGSGSRRGGAAAVRVVSASSRRTALVIAPRAMVIMQRILSYLAQKIIVQQLAQSPAFQRLALRIAAQLKKGEAWVQAGARVERNAIPKLTWIPKLGPPRFQNCVGADSETL